MQRSQLACFAQGTDAGVHATGQVVHFETSAIRKEAAWTMGANTHLPPDIAVRWCKPVAEEFHARFSATARRYRYVIFNHRYRPAILSSGVTHFHYPLDEKECMKRHRRYWVNVILPHSEQSSVSQSRHGVM